MNTELLQKIKKDSLRSNDISFRVGDKVKVYTKIKDQSGFRTQVFEGFVISVKHGGSTEVTYTVRRMGKDGIAVEKIFKLHSDFVEKVEVVQKYKARRAKLHFLRERLGDIKLPIYAPKVKPRGKRMEFLANTIREDADDTTGKAVEDEQTTSKETNELGSKKSKE